MFKVETKARHAWELEPKLADYANNLGREYTPDKDIQESILVPENIDKALKLESYVNLP